MSRGDAFISWGRGVCLVSGGKATAMGRLTLQLAREMRKLRTTRTLSVIAGIADEEETEEPKDLGQEAR